MNGGKPRGTNLNTRRGMLWRGRGCAACSGTPPGTAPQKHKTTTTERKKKIKTGKKYQRERNENIPNLEQRLLAEQSAAAGNREGKKRKTKCENTFRPVRHHHRRVCCSRALPAPEGHPGKNSKHTHRLPELRNRKMSTNVLHT